mmetsp:Transcript_49582/g.57897  ORF Transcript_49582/g.57897 Transcript_49582/m.57897 type:complete len:246 (+) Transcript_49582:239-976(+)
MLSCSRNVAVQVLYIRIYIMYNSFILQNRYDRGNLHLMLHQMILSFSPVGNVILVPPCFLFLWSLGVNVYSCAVGKLSISQHLLDEKSDVERSSTSISASVVPVEGRTYAFSQKVLSVGQVVLGRVTRINIQQATIEIIAAQGQGALGETHGGTIRKEDVRQGASEDVEIRESYRPGDIVTCRIIALGDSRRYFLSTAENELGVVKALCESSGEIMTPVSWKEMECPSTKTRELRKCAKPRDIVS